MAPPLKRWVNGRVTAAAWPVTGSATRQALYCFIVRSVGEQWLDELGEAVGDKVGLEAIHAATDAHDRFVNEASQAIRAFYILWFNSIGPDPELKEVIAHIHARRQHDVEAWIERGIADGCVRRDADVSATAQQFCAAIIGIVYQWLVDPDAHAAIHALHHGLKQQMTVALATKSGQPQPGGSRS